MGDGGDIETNPNTSDLRNLRNLWMAPYHNKKYPCLLVFSDVPLGSFCIQIDNDCES